MPDKKNYAMETLLTHAGNHPEAHHGIVDPPVYHASTVLYRTVEQMERAQKDRLSGVFYGRYGTPTTFALEEAVAAFEGGGRALALPSGLAAIGATLLSLLKAGDHLLMVDSVYGPARALCDKTLARFGIEVTYYDPLVGAGIAELTRPNTRLVYLESPGSLTFEVQDVQAIVAAVHAKGALAVMDNTRATPLLFRALGHGIDIVIHAGGHGLVAGRADAQAACRPRGGRRSHRRSRAGFRAAPRRCLGRTILEAWHRSAARNPEKATAAGGCRRPSLRSILTARGYNERRRLERLAAICLKTASKSDGLGALKKYTPFSSGSLARSSRNASAVGLCRGRSR